MLQKLNKVDYTILKAYRVISVLNCLGKVVEKTMATWILDRCEKNHLLYKGQFGCRKGCSTLDTLAQLVIFIEKV